MSAADPAAPTPTSVASAPAKKYAAHLVYRIAPCVFFSPKFPDGAFQQNELVRDFLGPVTVQTTFYNAQFQEVPQADMPGRYGAVVQIKLRDGTEVTRYITLYRAPKKIQWRTTDLDMSLTLPPELGLDPAVNRHQQKEIASSVKDLLREGGAETWSLAVLLAGLSEVDPKAGPEVQRVNFWARDTAWWFELRKRIGQPESYAYLIQLPEGYDAQPDKHWPLILFLHGSGERGTNLQKVNANGLPKLIAAGRKFPAIVVSPQCPENEWWNPFVLSHLLDDLSAKYRVDADRIDVTGLSMGGFGSWTLALAYPDRFAAVVPICGGSDPLDAARLRQLPIWAFHGEKDDTVPVEMTTKMIAAIRAAGGHPHLTLFPDAGHDSWTQAYATEALYTWLLAQQRGHAEVKTPGTPTP